MIQYIIVSNSCIKEQGPNCVWHNARAVTKCTIIDTNCYQCITSDRPYALFCLYLNTYDCTVYEYNGIDAKQVYLIASDRPLTNHTLKHAHIGINYFVKPDGYVYDTVCEETVTYYKLLGYKIL